MEFDEKETPIPEDLEQYNKNFSEKGFWNKLKKVSKKLGLKTVYVALLLYYVMTSGEVDLKSKLAIAGALGYLILPLDLIPDFIPIAGFTDDAAALMAALTMVSSNITPTIQNKAIDKLHDFFGNFDAEEIKNIPF